MTAPRDYRPTHAALLADVSTMLAQHPDSFEALYYKADRDNPETVAVGEDVVGALDTSERSLHYADPVSVRAMIVPEFMPFPMTTDGDRVDGERAEPVVLLLSEQDVPNASVIQWEEYVDATNTRQIALYVVKGEQVGVAPGVCAKLYCLPMQAFADLM